MIGSDLRYHYSDKWKEKREIERRVRKKERTERGKGKFIKERRIKKPEGCP